MSFIPFCFAFAEPVAGQPSLHDFVWRLVLAVALPTFFVSDLRSGKREDAFIDACVVVEQPLDV